jgi:hypothetical protein
MTYSQAEFKQNFRADVQATLKLGRLDIENVFACINLQLLPNTVLLIELSQSFLRP